jgi:hypothetical protein
MLSNSGGGTIRVRVLLVVNPVAIVPLPECSNSAFGNATHVTQLLTLASQIIVTCHLISCAEAKFMSFPRAQASLFVLIRSL